LVEKMDDYLENLKVVMKVVLKENLMVGKLAA
jgi:hypothetical protein